MILNPGFALLTGVCAGAMSTVGFSHLAPALKRRGLTDTCGIAHLHLIPGLLGGLVSALASLGVTGDLWPDAAISAAFPGRGTRSAALQVYPSIPPPPSPPPLPTLQGVVRSSNLQVISDSFYEKIGMRNL